MKKLKQQVASIQNHVQTINKQNKKKQTSTVNQKQMDVQGIRLEACEPSHLQNNKLVNDT